MGECRLDHSIDDVKKKYEDQKAYLPENVNALFENFLREEHTQDLLNEVFHLLKKYDLATEEERMERINRLNLILKNV